MKKEKGYYTIQIVSEIFNVTPQTLRLYEEKGLVQPSRSQGNKRLYTDADVEKLELVMRLTRDLGVNLAGVEVILNMRGKMMEMEKTYNEIVELLINDFQEMVSHLNEEGEEGLIPLNHRKLMQIKQHFAATGARFEFPGPVTTHKNSEKGS